MQTVTNSSFVEFQIIIIFSLSRHARETGTDKSNSNI